MSAPAASEILSTLRDPILVSSLEGHLLYANSAAGRYFSRPLSEGSPIDKLGWPGDLSQKLLRRIHHVVLHGGVEFIPLPDLNQQSPSGLLRELRISPIQWESERDAAAQSGALLTVQDRAPSLGSTASDDLHAQLETLRQTESLHRIVIENLTETTLLLDHRNRIRFASPAFVELIGKKADELKGQPYKPSVHEEDVSIHQEECKCLASPPYSGRFAYRIHTRLGWRWIEWHNSSVTDTDTRHILKIGRDITEFKQVEQAQALSERKFSLLTQHIPGVVYLCFNDESFTMLYLNNWIRRISGYTKEEFLEGSVSLSRLAHRDDLPRVREEIDAAVQARRSFEISLRLRHRNGDYRWVEGQGVPVFNESSGELLWLEGFFSDVTDARRSQMQLEEARRRYLALFDAGIIGMAVSDGTGRIVQANDLFRSLLLYSEKEMRAQNWKRLLPVGEEGFVLKSLHMLTTVGRMPNEERELLRKDGFHVPVLVGAAATRMRGVELEEYVSYVLDLSPIREAQQRVERTQKLQATAALTGGVSHEFNNALGGMISCAELALRELPSEAGQRQYLEQLLRHAAQAREIVRQLRSFTKGPGQDRLPLRMDAVVSEAVQLVRIGKPANVEIIEEMTEDEWIVRANSTQIHQVLVNLCKNAIDAMEPGGGRLSINLSSAAPEELGISSPKAERYLRIDVADTGPGISKKNIRKIFEPFFTTKDESKGTGLGLAVVKSIVETYEGVLDVQSGEGKGATFTIGLPCMESVPELEASLRPPPGDESMQGRILIVDDDVELAHFTSRLLRHVGLEVEVSSEAEKELGPLIDKARQSDLVLMDYNMPGISGIELAEHFQRSIEEPPPVLIVTGMNLELDAQTRRRLNVVSIVMKPVELQELLALIRRFRRKPRGTAPAPEEKASLSRAEAP